MKNPQEKIFSSAKNFIPTGSKLKESGKKLVFTNGCFDIIHCGHCYYLYKARLQGDFLVVAVNSDNSVRRIKGEGRPIVTLNDRMWILASLYFVDAVFPFEKDTPLEVIKLIKPEILVKGSDWNISEIVGAKEVIANGGSVKTIEILPEYSTSSIINKISRMNSTD